MHPIPPAKKLPMKSSPNSLMRQFANGMIAIGVGLVALGVAAIALAVTAPGFIGWLLAVVFLLLGALRLSYALQTQPEGSFRLKLSIAILNLFTSLIVFTTLSERYFSLATVIGTILLVQGSLELALSASLSPGTTRNVFRATGLGGLALGALLIVRLGIGAVWLLGVIGALSLVVPGGWLIFVARTLQRSDERSPQPLPRFDDSDD